MCTTLCGGLAGEQHVAVSDFADRELVAHYAVSDSEIETLEGSDGWSAWRG